MSVSAAARAFPLGGGNAGRRLAGHGRRSNLELLSHGVGIFVLCRRGTRDEFNSDWSLSITSSLGTLFSSPLRSVPWTRRGLVLLVSLLAATIPRASLSVASPPPRLSLSPSLVVSSPRLAPQQARSRLFSILPSVSLFLSSLSFSVLRSFPPCSSGLVPSVLSTPVASNGETRHGTVRARGSKHEFNLAARHRVTRRLDRGRCKV